MRVAALYDIHGNLPALRAVLADVARDSVDLVLIGGDVATGPLPRQTLDQLIALGSQARCVRGNADREIVSAYDSDRRDIDAEEDPAMRASAFAAAQISREQRDLLASFAPSVLLHPDGLGPTVFCHGSPRSDSEILTTETTEQRLRTIIEDVDQSVIVCGHTHRQFDRRVDRWRVVNAGSVGMPYEGRPGAYWALFGPGVESRRTEYDLDAAVGELRAGRYPDLEEMLKESLVEPADPDDVARFFEGSAAGAG
jgi:predicted phosphodiesterase